MKALVRLSPAVAAAVDFYDNVYCLCTICCIVDSPNVVKPHNGSYLMDGCCNPLRGVHFVKQTFYSCYRERKAEEVGVLRRAISFESNEGTAATECKLDFVEIVDSNDESISGDESETTSNDESEIEDGQEDSEQVCPIAFPLKAELSFLDGIQRQNNTKECIYLFWCPD